MEIKVKEIQVKSVMTKSNLPIGGYSVNPYVGCIHGCRYCYASFMKRFTGHTEAWGSFLDVKYWPKIENPKKYKDQIVMIGSVTDGYNQLEEKYQRTRALLQELKYSDAKIMITTKSNLILRDLDILKEMKDVTISFSINTLDEEFKNDMDKASSIKERLEAMRICYENGIRTVCFISPIFPLITDIKAIINEAKDYSDFIWLENLNLRGDYKATILNYIKDKYPEFYDTYDQIYNKRSKQYWIDLEKDIHNFAIANGYPYIDNYLPNTRSERGKPTIINYLYHEEVRGSDNSGKRNR